MDKEKIKEKSESLQKQLGGKIFAFPVEDENPFSKYAVAMFDGEKMNVFPDEMSIQEAASGINLILESLKKEGLDHSYERLVRLISYDAQLNAPDVTMRRLKKEITPVSTYAGFKEGDDTITGEDGEVKYFTSRGLLKLNYILLVEDKNPISIKFLDEYCNLLSQRKYGKTAAAIKQEVRRMNRNEALKWMEKTHEKYISDPMEVFKLMEKAKSPS